MLFLQKKLKKQSSTMSVLSKNLVLGFSFVLLGMWLSSIALADKDKQKEQLKTQTQQTAKQTDPQKDAKDQASSDDMMAMTMYEVDTKSSKLHWLGDKVIGDAHDGHVMLKSGSVKYKKDMPIKATMVVDMATITNDDIKKKSLNKKLVDHLLDEDFFYVEKYPTSTLNITKFTKLSEASMYKVMGDITIRGVTKPVSFDTMMMVDEKMLSAKGKFSLDRTMFNVKYNSKKFFPSLGDKIINDEFDLSFTLKAAMMTQADKTEK